MNLRLGDLAHMPKLRGTKIGDLTKVLKKHKLN
jgi:hypothetical protein